MSDETPELQRLRERAEAEGRAYAEALAAVDRLAAFGLPVERRPELSGQMERLNALWEGGPPPRPTGVSAPLQRRVWDTVADRFARQQEWNAAVVQVLNVHHEENARLFAHLRTLVQELLRWLQRVEPAMDARDRYATAVATTRAELILEAFDRRQESFAARLRALLALRDRIETIGEQVDAVRATLAAAAPAPEVAASATRAADDAIYAAFENRFRGDDVRDRLAGYAERLRGRAPIVDLGCGRGELLDVLREAGVTARGVDENLRFVQACRDRGLDVVHGNLLDFVDGAPAGSLGALVAIQVAEHLPPPALQRLLVGAHRALRAGGVLVLETVNPRSVIGLLEVYNRDLTHERPLHPDTLSFLAAAAGFTEVSVEMRAPVEPAARLQPVPTEGLPERAARALNENVERLNALLYGPQEYALVATR